METYVYLCDWSFCNGDGVLCEIQAEVKETVDHKKITTHTESVFCEIRAEAKETQSNFNNQT
jgi:hypothetical protein